MLDQRAAPQSHVFAFLLVPGFSMMSLASAIEPLRSLNRLLGKDVYQWRLASIDGKPLAASNGIALPAVKPDAALKGPDYFFVCGGLRIKSTEERKYLAILRDAARRRIAVGSLSTGTYLLARAGLLDGYRCTIHWENRAAFKEDFPNLDCTSKIYEIDRDRLTCSGGTAAMDMMLHIIAHAHGADLAHAVANQFHHERIRGAQDDQRGGRLDSLVGLPPKLRSALNLMQQQIEEPLTLPAVAKRVGLSARQLERLFLRHFRTTPLRYYMQLRIERARELLLYSDRPILEIAISAGFSSVSHFSAWYRRVFGMRPSELRGRGSARPAASSAAPNGRRN